MKEIVPGFQFRIVPRERTTYYGAPYETEPLPIYTYVVCMDGTIQNVHDPTHRIGWTLHVIDNEYYYKSGTRFKRCHVMPEDPYIGNVPSGNTSLPHEYDSPIWSGTPPR